MMSSRQLEFTALASVNRTTTSVPVEQDRKDVEAGDRAVRIDEIEGFGSEQQSRAT